MQEDDGFKFGCPYCTQHIRAYLEHVGYQLNCPTCSAAIIVPDPSTAAPGQFAVGEIPYDEQQQGGEYYEEGYQDQGYQEYAEVDTHGFTNEEWQILQEEDYDVVERLIQLDRNLWWECGAAGELISSRLRVLAESVSPEREIYYHPGTHDEHLAFVYHIDQRGRDFFDIMNFLYHALTNELQRVSVRNNLLSIIQLADRVTREVHRLKEFHDFLYEHSLPQEQPFPEIQQIMVGWAPFIYRNLTICTDQLREKARGARGSWGDARLHVSLFPADLPSFFILKDKLARRIGQY